MSIHEKYAKLREAYPDEVDKINAEGERMMELLKTQEYYELPTTKRLIAMCRKHIVDARIPHHIQPGNADEFDLSSA